MRHCADALAGAGGDAAGAERGCVVGQVAGEDGAVGREGEDGFVSLGSCISFLRSIVKVVGK